ncbi:putative membrane protein [Caloramator quimbayensis]|uniref:Putative membrane protein n=1 Tax=Caloramator quimbayensis TaxID=1147123 RepID=A0A1T4XV03_9CLOT|nr:phage holin family protein [Caloramator quimbayensis]SKA93402.1 putative membrane protein [Caloramator quimbayensis]
MKSKKKEGFITRTLINAVAIYITAGFVKGVNISGFGAAIVASVVLGLVNAVIRPILILLSLPINIITLGLFTFIINGVSLLFVSTATSGFYISSLSSAVIASFIISIISSIISFLI